MPRRWARDWEEKEEVCRPKTATLPVEEEKEGVCGGGGSSGRVRGGKSWEGMRWMGQRRGTRIRLVVDVPALCPVPGLPADCYALLCFLQMRCGGEIGSGPEGSSQRRVTGDRDVRLAQWANGACSLCCTGVEGRDHDSEQQVCT